EARVPRRARPGGSRRYQPPSCGVGGEPLGCSAPPARGDVTLTRYRPSRIVAVTLGLSLAGVVFGALARVVAVTINLLLTDEFSLHRVAAVYAVAATLGAMLGAVCAPVAGWLLLRYV